MWSQQTSLGQLCSSRAHLELGKIGMFDDSEHYANVVTAPNGEMALLHRLDGQKYYSVPQRIGLAISKDGIHYEKKFEGGDGTIPTEPQFSGSCCVA
jgi:hypothetical protein